MAYNPIIVNARFLTQKVTGVQRFAIEICLRLKELMNEDIIFVTPNSIIQHDYAHKLNARTIGFNKGHLWEQIDLPKFLRSHNNPLLLCLCNTAPLLYSRKISTIHDVAFEAYPSTFNKLFCLSYRFMIPQIIRTSEHILTVSEFSKSEIIKYYGTDPNKISVVYNAASQIFRRKENSRITDLEYFLAVSSLNYRKNFIAVLQAFELLQNSITDIDLYVIGDLNSDNFQGVDISKFRKNPQIKFLGRVSDEELVDYYNNAKAFVYPSIYEGFGIPPLEAQSCGCPVIVSDIPPLHEVVGNSGLYCNPYSIKDIEDKMIEVIDSADLKKHGLINVARFSWDKSASKIAKILRKFNTM